MQRVPFPFAMDSESLTRRLAVVRYRPDLGGAPPTSRLSPGTAEYL